MSRQYLDVPYRAKDAAKALGARFDGAVKRWYVEANTDLVAFVAWLPAGAATPDAAVAAVTVASTDAALAPVKKGVALSSLLNGVAAAVDKAFTAGVWTLVEVNEASTRGGHVYLELSERDSTGQPIARARAMIWARTAARILPDFEKATGAVIGAGIKLLVRARPVFKAQYGLSLEIDAIDPEYTLGDLEARKKEIRMRLRQEGVFDSNRQLVAPWDYRLVLVVAPQAAAGLGDFQKEAERLERYGICRFVYAHSRFQGEGAAGEIVAAAAAALAKLGRLAAEIGGTGLPDAIVFIRGGGAVNDLAWLDDYALARFICDQAIPVHTGIGHERDNTLLDEVANTSFDTPSKVIAGIEQQILRRVREARQAWQDVATAGVQVARNARLATERQQSEIRADTAALVSHARQDSRAALNDIAVGAVRQVHSAASGSLVAFSAVRSDASDEIAMARQRAPALLASVRIDALANVGAGKVGAGVSYNTVIDRAAAAARSTRQSLDAGLQLVADRASGAVQHSRGNAQALMREVTGQGPDKTLARGFAIVRTAQGHPVTTSRQAEAAATLSIQFRDGYTDIRIDPSQKRKTP